MLDQLIEQLEQQLSQHGEIIEVIMRTEQSLLAEQVSHEVELLFAENEDAIQDGKPTAVIHVFPLEKGLYEVEVEVTYDCLQTGMESERLLAAAQQVIAEITLTEKRRFLEPGSQVERLAILSFHFVLELAMEQDEGQYQALLGQWAKDTGKLIRLQEAR